MVGPLIEIARARRAEVRAVYLDVPLQVCLARSAGRVGRVVCPLLVFTLLENRLVPPILDEGFDQVDVVTSGDGS
jgi:predicted kinase